MSKVKRYWPEEIVGTGELVVYAQDYAALEAECEGLRERLEVAKSDELNASVWAETEAIRHEMWDAQRERDTLRAELAAIKGQWIPVSERLPSVAQEVIVSSDFDGVTAGFLDSYGEWYAPNSDYKLTRVVAWQPFPPLPQPLPPAPAGVEG